MRTYEVLFILHPQLAEGEVTDLVAEFRKIAEDADARFVSEDPWGKRRLSYPIEKLNDGIYHLFVFEAEAEQLSELDRKMKNSDKVMRHLIVRTDEMQKRATKLALKNPKKERAPKPSVEAPKPPVEAPKPPADAPTPSVEASTPTPTPAAPAPSAE
jgi:small subunit ribosomal protein S6